MSRQRRVPSPFNLSMLDVIACGLGAMVLLFRCCGRPDSAVRSRRDEEIVEMESASVQDIESRIEVLDEEARELEEQAKELLNRLQDSRTYSTDLESERDRLKKILEDLKRQRMGETEEDHGFSRAFTVSPIEVTLLEGILINRPRGTLPYNNSDKSIDHSLNEEKYESKFFILSVEP